MSATGGPALERREFRTYPFSTTTVVLVNDLLQLCCGLVVLALKGSFTHTLSRRPLLLQTIPLGFLYAVGELLTMRAVQKGSGPLYVILSNLKLVVSAILARALFGSSREMPWVRWLQLVFISLLAAAYALAEAGTLGAAWRWEGAAVALVKCAVASIISVLCEYAYQGGTFVAVVTLQAFWSLVFISAGIFVASTGLAMGGLAAELTDGEAFTLFGSGPAIPLCSSSSHTECVQALAGAAGACRCVVARGWDVYTLGAVLADLSNAVSSALIFKRLSAVVKYICRAMSAVPLYVFYCLTGRRSADLPTFAIIAMLCYQVALYTVRRHEEALAKRASGNEGKEV